MKAPVLSVQADYPSSGFVTFTATVDDTVPPMTISEVGLMDATTLNDNLFGLF